MKEVAASQAESIYHFSFEGQRIGVTAKREGGNRDFTYNFFSQDGCQFAAGDVHHADGLNCVEWLGRDGNVEAPELLDILPFLLEAAIRSDFPDEIDYDIGQPLQ